MSEEKEKTSAEAAESAEDEGRPPVDPKNKLYTVISLLIFAVGYVGIQLLKENFTLTYALYDNMPAANDLTCILREIDMDEMPEEYHFRYARLHKNFDDNALYISVALPSDAESMEEASAYAERIIPYDYGNVVEDECFTVYPYADMNADYVYGNCYVCVDDPKKSCLVYEDENGGYTAMFRTHDYDSKIPSALGGGEKIKIK